MSTTFIDDLRKTVTIPISKTDASGYIGRIAPTPSGYMHGKVIFAVVHFEFAIMNKIPIHLLPMLVGHAQTFLIACKRAKNFHGKLVLRIEDLDSQRCKPQYLIDMLEDLAWIGISWSQGPQLEQASLNGTNTLTINPNSTRDPATNRSYIQTHRIEFYKDAWKRLLEKGLIYPSPHSRKDVERALSAPHEGDAEVIFPTELRPIYMQQMRREEFPVDIHNLEAPTKVNWRFRVPDGEAIKFHDIICGDQSFIAGSDFGDFLVWRSDGYPSYELAVVVDDSDMKVTEVVRGDDLLLSTARQILLYVALDLADSIPSFCHTMLLRDDAGKRLAKRSDAKSLRALRAEGLTPDDVVEKYFHPSFATCC